MKSLVINREDLKHNIRKIKEIAKDTGRLDNHKPIKIIAVVKGNGYDYPVKINIGNFYFPTKNYGDISLPAGPYDALKVEIGEAKGQNWWCVMFPSLCFIDISSGIVNDEAKENLEENLDNESYNLISNTSTETTFKFKLVEFFADKKLFTANK